MDRHTPEEPRAGVDLLLAGSDAFGHLAEQLARAHEDVVAGGGTLQLDWLRSMAELAGWWCGRLEAEADYTAGFLPDAPEETSAGVSVDKPSSPPPSFPTRKTG